MAEYGEVMKRRVLEFIETYIMCNSFSPSLRDIGKHFGLAPSNVLYWIRQLEAEGAIVYAHGKARTIQIVREDCTCTPRDDIPCPACQSTFKAGDVFPE